MRFSFLLAAATTLTLGACEHGPNGAPYMGGPDNFGEANRQTLAAQVVDPAPVYDTAVPETHAEHAAQAVERYRMDKVKLPDRVKTNDSVIGRNSEQGQ
jgi:hypothetical protein